MLGFEPIIIGGGPAGLAAAHALGERGIPGLILEKDTQVGGLCKTVNYLGFRCDLGGHRFFTKSKEVQNLWNSMLGDDFLIRPRLSRT
jgi:protoporphyrinogen oxidase